ncbi:MAG: hypothetical protein ACJAXN_000614 [Psychromonas sp.]|jgi:hypothetical protein
MKMEIKKAQSSEYAAALTQEKIKEYYDKKLIS